MKAHLPHWPPPRPTGIGLLAAGLFWSGGCHRQPPAAPPDAAHVKAVVQAAFRDADPRVKNQAAAALTALDHQNAGQALYQLRALATRPGLTASERAAAAQATLELNRLLADRAARGDQDAAAALSIYQSSR